MVLRPLAIALTLQLLALPVAHAFAPCHESEAGHDCCAHSAVGEGDHGDDHDALHADLQSADHDLCQCPCHARTLTASVPPTSPVARMTLLGREPPRGSPPWRGDPPPTPPPQA